MAEKILVAESLDQYLTEKKGKNKEKEDFSSFRKFGKESNKAIKKLMKTEPKPNIHFPDEAAIQFAKGAGHDKIVKSLKKDKKK